MADLTMEGFRKEVAHVNKKSFSNLSADEIYSRVEEIMKKPQEEWADAFVEYMKELNEKLFENVSYNRSLYAFNAARWGTDLMATCYQYRISDAMREARNLINYSRKIIKPETEKTFEYAEPQFAKIRDWQIERLKTFTEYAEIERTADAWDYSAARSYFKENNEKIEPANSQDIKEKYQFSGNYEKTEDQLIANAYARAKMFKAEYEKHNFFWKWFTRKGWAYGGYISRSEKLFKNVGFDEKKHAEEAIKYCKNKLPEPYETDIDIVKGNYESQVESYKIAHRVVTFEAREYTNWALELDLDPEFGIESKLTEFVEKYGIKSSDLLTKIDWGSGATAYDTLGKTETLQINARTTFGSTLAKLIDAAAKKYGAEMNITEVLDDARKIAIISAKFHSTIFEIEELKNVEKPPYIADDFTAEYIEKRTKTYFLRNAKDLSPEDKERIAKAAADHVKAWYDDLDKLKKEDAELISTVTRPEISEISPVERKIINKLLTVGYRPPKRDYDNIMDNHGKLMDKHAKVVEMMKNKWFGENSKHPEGLKEVFEKNVEKLKALEKVKYKDMKAIADLDEAWDKSDLEMKENYPNYQPKTLEDLEAQNETRVQMPPIDLGENKNVERQAPIKEENVLVKSSSVNI